MDTNISTLLREIKNQTGWNQVLLAKELGVSQPTIHRILHGQTDCKLYVFHAISKLHKSVTGTDTTLAA